MRRAIMFVPTIVFLLAVSGGVEAAYFVGLGDLPGGIFYSWATGVSANGSVVAGTSYSSSGGEAFRWTQSTGMVGLGDLPSGSFYSEAQGGVSADGLVVAGGSFIGSGGQAFRWTQGSGMVGLGYLPGDIYSWAMGVSADGSTVVGRGSSRAFRWTSSGGMVSLGELPGGEYSSMANGVSADGSVVVGNSHSAYGAEAFRWTQSSGMVGLGDLPGGEYRSSANSVSTDGSVVVGDSSSGPGILGQAFRWTQSTGMVGLGDLPGGDFFSSADGVSGDGSIVVGCSSSAYGTEAFIWDTTNGMQRLRDVLVGLDLESALTGWTLEYANSISADGTTIVGYGKNPAGDTEAWIANINPVPIPGAVLLFGSGLIGLAGLRRKLPKG